MGSSKYTKEFRDSAVQLVVNGNEPVLKIAADLDVKSKTLYNWLKAYKESHNITTDNYTNSIKSTSKETSEEELKRLRSENRLLKQERDILKKATAYFAKETL